MVYLKALAPASLFKLLFRIDVALAAEVQAAGCPHCAGPLHQARYVRKPRGGPELPEEYCIRHGLCCGHCRRRTLPPSVLFLGRKVYWGATVVGVAALRQRDPRSWSAAKLKAVLGVWWTTVKRWLRWWREDFPSSRAWRSFRGRVGPQLRDDDLPACVLEAIASPMRLRSLLLSWARSEHAARGAPGVTQKMSRSQN